MIIPTYNRAGLIGATLDSLRAQTRPPDEVIVADDGSTDDTAAVVAGRAPQAVSLSLPRRGHCAARNAGMRVSTGDALCFLDSDDLLLPGALAALESSLAGSPDAAVAYCRAQIIGADGALVSARWEREDHAGEVWEHLLWRNFIRSPGCALVRSDRLADAGGWDESLKNNVDWDVWLRLAERWPFARVEEPLFQYRVHGGNLSGNNVRMTLGALRVLDKQARRHRGDAARSRAVASSARRYAEFGLGEVLAGGGREAGVGTARALVGRSLGLRPLGTLGQAARALLLNARRALPCPLMRSGGAS